MKNKLSFSTLKHLINNSGSKDYARFWLNDKNIILNYCQDLKHDIKVIGDINDELSLDYIKSIKELESLIFDIAECVKYYFESDYDGAIDRFCKLYVINSNNIDLDCIEQARDLSVGVTVEYVRNMYYNNLFYKLSNGK